MFPKVFPAFFGAPPAAVVEVAAARTVTVPAEVRTVTVAADGTVR